MRPTRDFDLFVGVAAAQSALLCLIAFLSGLARNPWPLLLLFVPLLWTRLSPTAATGW